MQKIAVKYLPASRGKHKLHRLDECGNEPTEVWLENGHYTAVCMCEHVFG